VILSVSRGFEEVAISVPLANRTQMQGMSR
jgi:hypothetical protein